MTTTPARPSQSSTDDAQRVSLPVLRTASPRTARNEGRRGRGSGARRDAESLAHELADVVRDAATQVRFSRHDRLLYSTDASLYQVEPLGVVAPGSVADLERIVSWAARRGVPVLARGGGTSLAGQCMSRAVVVDTTPGLRRVLEIDADARTCLVEPGVSVDQVNAELARRGTGLFFAPDPATVAQCAIGGCIGNNAAGARSVRYGRTSENLAGVRVILADESATTVWLGQRPRGASGGGDASAEGSRADAQEARVVADLSRRVAAVVRAHARIIRERFPKTIRRNAGYALDSVLAQLDAGAADDRLDLSGLVCGSEGTLAVTSAALLKLHTVPAARGLAVVSFESVEQAIEAVGAILETKPSAVELLDDVVLGAAAGNAECRRYLDLIPGWSGAARGVNSAHGRESAHGAGGVLYVEYFAEHAAGGGLGELEKRFARLDGVLSGLSGVRGMSRLKDAGSMARAWALRKAGEPLLHGLSGKRKPITFIEDNAVPVENLGRFVRELRAIVSRHGTRAAFWAHASVGVLHVRPMIDLHDPEDLARMRAIAVEAADLARECGGIMSGEHGDGRVRGPLLERFFGPELAGKGGAFQQIKRIFDPRGILNPGNITSPGPIESITTNLRTQAAAGHTGGIGGDDAPMHGEDRPNTGNGLSSLRTFFDYSDYEGFAHAIETCNGAGVCRKTSGGAMCPSFRATLDERHSTRGRANALRMALTGQSRGSNDEGGMDEGRDGSIAGGRVVAGESGPDVRDAETLATLDLCLSCKACKTECPSNVDISRFKAEYLAQGFAAGASPTLADLAIANVRGLSMLASLAPGLVNRINSTRAVRALMRRLMGIDTRRSLPEFRRPLHSWFRAHYGGDASGRHRSGAEDGGDSGKYVVLFADCFTTFNEPRIGAAAVLVLERLGVRVRLLPGKAGFGGCCGRPAISRGLLAQATETIDATLAELEPAIIDPGCEAIVVCEPSCLSAFKDDWLSLRVRTDRALRERLAAKAMLVEEFVGPRLVTRGRAEHGLSAPDGASTGGAEGAGTGKLGNVGEIVLHAHCHQKALWGAEASARVLRTAFGADRVRVLDSTCCGMAGSFGYAESHFDLSARIAELSVAPGVRGAGESAMIAATGTSCRHQILDTTGRVARHPVELLAEALGCEVPEL